MEQLKVDATRRFSATPLLLMTACGLATTAAALVGVWYVEKRFHESVMTWSIYFLPIGAIVVGLVAASGYLFAGHALHVRLPKQVAWVFFGLQVLAYFAAQYVQFKSKGYVYRDTLEPVGFWEYFNMIATSYTLEHGNGAPIHLGPVGYVIKLLEIVLFGIGGYAATAATSSNPYCETCKRYRRTKHLATILATHFTTADEDGVADEAQVSAGAHAAFEALATIAEAGAADVFTEQLKDHRPRLDKWRLPSRLEVNLSYCPGCFDATLSGLIVLKRETSSRIESPTPRALPAAVAEQMLNRRAGSGGQAAVD